MSQSPALRRFLMAMLLVGLLALVIDGLFFPPDPITQVYVVGGIILLSLPVALVFAYGRG